MDADAIKVFLRVAGIGNLTRAAETLGISQPSVTRLISQMEHEVGARLFERTRRGVVLSDAGRYLAERLPSLLNETEQLFQEARTGAFEPTGRVNVGIPQSMRAAIALPLVHWFAERFPCSTMSLQLGVSHEIEQGLGFGQLDIGILISPRTETPNLKSRALAVEPLCLVVPPDHPPPGPSDWHDVIDRPMILPSPLNPLRRRVDASARELGRKVKLVAEVSDAAAMLQLVRDGLGCTLLPRSIVCGFGSEGALRHVAVGHERIVWTLAISGHSAASVLRDAVEEHLDEMFTDHAAAGRWTLTSAVAPTNVA